MRPTLTNRVHAEMGPGREGTVFVCAVGEMSPVKWSSITSKSHILLMGKLFGPCAPWHDAAV